MIKLSVDMLGADRPETELAAGAIVSLAVQRIVRKKNRTKAPKTAKPSKK